MVSVGPPGTCPPATYMVSVEDEGRSAVERLGKVGDDARPVGRRGRPPARRRWPWWPSRPTPSRRRRRRAGHRRPPRPGSGPGRSGRPRRVSGYRRWWPAPGQVGGAGVPAHDIRRLAVAGADGGDGLVRAGVGELSDNRSRGAGTGRRLDRDRPGGQGLDGGHRVRRPATHDEGGGAEGDPGTVVDRGQAGYLPAPSRRWPGSWCRPRQPTLATWPDRRAR